MERHFLVGCIDAGMSLEEIGELAGRHPSTVGYWLKRHGLRAVGADKFAPRGGIGRAELSELVKKGLTIREIGDELGRSISTVRHWLKRYDLRTDPQNRRALREQAAAEGRTRITSVCRRHGEGEFHIESSGRLRCVRCRGEAVARRRQVAKEILVDEAGGSCRICGYDRDMAALQFHHLDPTQKEFSLSMNGVTRGIEAMRREAGKCILLCANCHAEVEVGRTELPLERAKTPPGGFEPPRTD